MSIDFPRKQGEPLVGDRWAIERMHFEVKEILGFQQLGQNHFAVVGAVRCVVTRGTVFLLELNKSSILNTVGFRGTKGKYQSFRQPVSRKVGNLVVRLSQRDDARYDWSERLVLSSVFPKSGMERCLQDLQRKRLF